MKQTALQQLIERLEKRYQEDKELYHKHLESGSLAALQAAKGRMYSSRDAWKTACEFKEAGKQDIIESRLTAPILSSPYDDDYAAEAEQYYTKTFKN